MYLFVSKMSVLTIDISKIPVGIEMKDFMVLLALYRNDDSLSYHRFEDLIVLETHFYVKRLIDLDTGEKSIILRKKGEELVKRVINEQSINVTSLTSKIRELFPKGRSDNGYYFRGTEKEIAKKLNSFIKTYGSYSEEDFIQATKNYISTFSNGDYRFLKLCKYFIEKDGGSTLYEYLENLGEAESNEDWTKNVL